jgi:hypothetical protein
MFESLYGSIKEGFASLLPHDFCVPCFLKGLAEGIGFGVLSIGVLAVVATLAAPLAGAIALILAIVGITGLAYMAANWKNMNDRQKSEALGGILGGALVGGTSGGLDVPTLTFEPILQPGGTLAMALVASKVAVSPAAVSVVGGGVGGSVAMIAGDGGSGGPTSNRGSPVRKGPIPDEQPQNLEEQLLMEDSRSKEIRGENGPPIQGGPRRPLKDEPRLIDNYGGKSGDWVKKTGPNKEINGVPTEVHYFKNTQTGETVEWKFKRTPRGNT